MRGPGAARLVLRERHSLEANDSVPEMGGRLTRPAGCGHFRRTSARCQRRGALEISSSTSREQRGRCARQLRAAPDRQRQASYARPAGAHEHVVSPGKGFTATVAKTTR